MSEEPRNGIIQWPNFCPSHSPRIICNMQEEFLTKQCYSQMLTEDRAKRRRIKPILSAKIVGQGIFITILLEAFDQIRCNIQV